MTRAADDLLITIIGGSGFIGRHTVRLLAQTGARIRVAVRHPNDALFLRPMGGVGQIALLQANVRHEDSLHNAIDGADAVVNLVGILANSGRQTFDAVHVGAAKSIARIAATCGVDRLIHLSAIGADPHGKAQYARSKGLGEQAVWEAFPQATVVRPSIVFGPEDDFFNRFAGMAQIAPALPLIGGGQTRFQPVYVEDVARAICRCIADEETAGKSYELGGPAVMTFREVLEYVLAQTHRDRALVNLPFGLAAVLAYFLQFAPGSPLTPDQVRLLQSDNIVADNALGLSDLGITPTPVQSVAPSYLRRYRRTGQFDRD